MSLQNGLPCKMVSKDASRWRPLVALLGGLSLNCATAATCMDSVTCCVETHPGIPEACGLTAAEAATIMAATAAAAKSLSASALSAKSMRAADIASDVCRTTPGIARPERF